MENPKIRFKGFTKDWEQRKLGDVFEQTSNLVNPKEDEIELWSLTVEDGLTKKSDRYNREFLVKKDDNFKEVRPGDIVYKPMNMTLGAVGYNGMAKSVAVSGYYTTMVAKENYDTYYINTWLKSPQAIRLYRTYATGSLIEKQRVQFPTLSIIPVTFPKYEEQIKIGSYFHSIDNLITLHQRKCEQTKKMKKYMLQKMFPQNGAKVPEIRFDGFTYDWEQRKFSELYARSSEKNDGSIGMDKNITVATMQFKNDVKVSTTEYLKTYYTFKLGDIAFEGHQSKEFRYGRFVENDIGNGIVSHIFAVFRPIQEYDLYFWKYAINNETLMQRILARSTKASTMMHDLVTNDFLNETFLVPSVKEQKQIGAFLNKLDNLITLHQRKCDELKKMKKYMLQNMFI